MRTSNNKTVEISVTIRRESEKAYLVTDGGPEVWVPKSQITEMTGKAPGPVTMIVSEWIAKEKGLI